MLHLQLRIHFIARQLDQVELIEIAELEVNLKLKSINTAVKKLL